MFHHLFDTVDFVSILVQAIGVTFIILPAVIASIKKSTNATVISTLNALVYALIDLSAFISTKSDKDTVSLTIFIGAWILWAVLVIIAMTSKKANKK